MPSRDGWTGHLPGWVPRVASTLCSPNRHQGRGLGSGHRLRDEKTTKTLFVPRVADCCTRLMKDLRGLIQFGRKRCRTGLGREGSAPPSPPHPRRRATLSSRHDAAWRTRLRLCTTGPSDPQGVFADVVTECWVALLLFRSLAPLPWLCTRHPRTTMTATIVRTIRAPIRRLGLRAICPRTSVPLAR